MSREQVHGAAGMRPAANGFGPRHGVNRMSQIVEEGA